LNGYSARYFSPSFPKVMFAVGFGDQLIETEFADLRPRLFFGQAFQADHFRPFHASALPRRHFGEEFNAYFQRTRRLIPFLY
jgi:NADPH-dependent ferric siderophore reductase